MGDASAWAPVIAALAGAISVLSLALASYLKSKEAAAAAGKTIQAVSENSDKLDNVAKQTNGVLDSITRRVEALERQAMSTPPEPPSGPPGAS